MKFKDLERLLKAVTDAGLPVSRVVTKDVEVHIGEPVTRQNHNEWDTVQ